MWSTGVTRLLGIELPVVLAPMGGGPSTVALAAAVSNAGGLGTLAGGYLTPDRLRDEIRQLRAATTRPFAVNLFIPTDVPEQPPQLESALRLLEPFRAELGLPPRPEMPAWAVDFDAQMAVVTEERVPVFTYTFGLLPPAATAELHAAGTVTIGTATNAAEAVALQEAGADAVCAQGSEAGGHHGTWLARPYDSAVGTLALVPLVRDAVDVPVIAAGGIMDGRGVAAVLCLGAGAAQMGTAFMLTPEAGTVAPHRRAMTGAAETDLSFTTTVTGRLARGVRNRLMDALRDADVPPYPVMNALTSELRRASAARDDPELMSLWCGQGAPLARQRPATDLVAEVAADVLATLEDVRGLA